MSLVLPLLPVVVIVAVIGLLYFFTIGRKHKNPGQKAQKLHGKDRAAVIREANKRLAQNPRDVEALQTLGEVFYNDEDFEKAMKTYSVLVALAGGNRSIDEYEATVRYALSALKCNNVEEAYKSLVLAWNMRADGFDVNHNLGCLEYQNKNYDRAIELLSQARVMQPDHAKTLRFLGLSLFRARRYAEGAALLKKAIDQEPEDKEALFAVARCYHELGQNEQAIKVFSHLRADPQLGPNAALFAGTIHLQTRQYGEAVQDFQFGLKHENVPNDILIELQYRLAVTYIKQDEIGEALRLLGEIQAASPDYRDVQELLKRYRELNTNHNLKIYLISPTSDFVSLCRKIVASYFAESKVKISDVSIQKSEYADILADVTTAKWEDLILFRFVRTTGTVGELIVRDLYTRIKEVKAGRGLCMAAGSFSEGARQFVEARLIDLVDKELLTHHLSSLDSGVAFDASQPATDPA